MRVSPPTGMTVEASELDDLRCHSHDKQSQFFLFGASGVELSFFLFCGGGSR